MNKLIVVPARGGSKGIPKKNIYKICGKPLICYTLDLVKSIDLPSTDVVVSSDDIEILKIASSYNNIYVIDRPKELSQDNSSTEDVLLHAIDYMKKMMGRDYEAVITLQPTSPLRKKESLIRFIEEYENQISRYDALLSLTEDRTDYWIRDSIGYRRLFPDAPRRRQERNPIFAENSAYYITDVEALKRSGSVLGTHPGGFVISAFEGIDINDYIDIAIAEALLREGNQ